MSALAPANWFTPPDWSTDAPCAQIGGDLWFPEQGGKRMYDEARRICAECPFRPECLELAMRIEGDVCKEARSGMYGGVTPAERASLSKQRRRERAA